MSDAYDATSVDGSDAQARYREWVEGQSESGAELLDAVAELLDRYVSFPSPEHRDAVALWAVHCHAVEWFESTPRLALLSPEKGSGKTRTLEVLDLLVPTPMHAVNMSPAALFRQVALARPTLLLDEADTYLGARTSQNHEDLRGLLNSGHRRGAVAYRCVGEGTKMNVVEFQAYAPAAIAGIGDLPDTLLDRAIIVRMKRRAPDERIEPFRHREAKPVGEPIRGKLVAWAAHRALDLERARPELPKGIVDRAADVWEPLLAVAEVADGLWPVRARAAAVKLVNESRAAEPSLGTMLLTDIRTIFDLEGADKLSSEAIVHKLGEMVESPWGDLRGKPMDARGLARRLRQFGLRTKNIKTENHVLKGFDRDDFFDAWQRYLPGGSESPLQALPPLPGRSEGVQSVADKSDVALPLTLSATKNRPLTCDVAEVAEVADLFTPPGASTLRPRGSSQSKGPWPLRGSAPDREIGSLFGEPANVPGAASDVVPISPEDRARIDQTCPECERRGGFHYDGCTRAPGRLLEVVPDVVSSAGTKHPAKFSPTILEAIAAMVPKGARVLDPFAGTGRIHDLDAETVGIELEPEWAGMHPQTRVGSALDLPFPDGDFDVVATSPTYGNRFADHHKAKDPSKRRSYTHDLGRTLHPDNSGAMHWGPAYRTFHEKAWAEARRVLRPGGLLILNISNHIRDHVEQPVTEWHTECIEALGFELEERARVDTPRLRHGQNAGARVDCEWVLVFRRAP